VLLALMTLLTVAATLYSFNTGKVILFGVAYLAIGTIIFLIALTVITLADPKKHELK